MEVTLEAEDATEASREDAESTANFAPLKESASLEHELRDCVLQSAGDSVASSGGTTPVPILSTTAAQASSSRRFWLHVVRKVSLFQELQVSIPRIKEIRRERRVGFHPRVHQRYKRMQLRGLGLDSSTERCKPRLVLKKANSPECGGFGLIDLGEALLYFCQCSISVVDRLSKNIAGDMVLSLTAAEYTFKSPQSFVKLAEIYGKVGEVLLCLFGTSEQVQGPLAGLDEGRYRS